MGKNAVMLIDFDSEVSSQLRNTLERTPSLEKVQVVPWPNPELYPKDFFLHEGNFMKINQQSILDDYFRCMKKYDPIFVIVNCNFPDKIRRTEFVGNEIRKWCQKNMVPVAEHSKAISDRLPHSQNLFDLHIPIISSSHLNYEYAFELISGFEQIRNFIKINDNKNYSYSEIIFNIFEGNCKEYEISQYLYPIFVNNFSLVEFISHKKQCAKPNFSKQERINILSYVVGHVLVNSILRFPGPIISDQALCAYVAMDFKCKGELGELFVDTKYDGPFSGIGTFYWKKLIDEKILELIVDLSDDEKVKDSTESTRLAIETQTGKLKKWNCATCKGKNGGYFCPYSQKTVCEYCSVFSSSWIPRGPNICRVESDLYKQWMPLLSD